MAEEYQAECHKKKLMRPAGITRRNKQVNKSASRHRSQLIMAGLFIGPCSRAIQSKLD